ncbi:MULTISPECIES: MtrAB system response regulator MtrA [Kocuria]|uniref:MtrAB system response regulator MtrA n=1 Tax=Kocuria TaxID=57493 RepID=UPI00065FEE07|nr:MULTISPECIES: MtrAB system response regulator MtrA [Kocuria]MCT1367539.1 MtrAB system response regulator MtrA [Rothia sp. p3-SID1597]RUQ22334.1 DNA-binding response regulator [Kocuria sp. HSID16901]
MKARILVVDDDEALSEMVGIVLSNEGYEPTFCDAGDRAVSAFESYDPDLILLDLMLPGMSGIDVCERIREVSDVPVIMLTAKSDTEDVVRGLEAGADDYIAKPFKPAELLARIRTRLRTGESRSAERIEIGDLSIDLAGRAVTRGEATVRLTPLEYDLLVNLAQEPGQVLSRDLLLDRIWGYDSDADRRLVNVHVQRLRAKIEKDPEKPDLIQTVRGVGYKANASQVRR